MWLVPFYQPPYQELDLDVLGLLGRHLDSNSAAETSGMCCASHVIVLLVVPCLQQKQQPDHWASTGPA